MSLAGKVLGFFGGEGREDRIGVNLVPSVVARGAQPAIADMRDQFDGARVLGSSRPAVPHLVSNRESAIRVALHRAGMYDPAFEVVTYPALEQ